MGSYAEGGGRRGQLCHLDQMTDALVNLILLVFASFSLFEKIPMTLVEKVPGSFHVKRGNLCNPPPQN